MPKRVGRGVRRQEEVQVLLHQYQVVANAANLFMGLIWQLPAVALTVVGVLVAVILGNEVSPLLRGSVLLVGALFMLVMAIVLERFRMFHLRRIRDLESIEKKLVKLGGSQFNWAGSKIVAEIDAGKFRPAGVRFYRVEGYLLLKRFMYFVFALLLGLSAYFLNMGLV